MVDINKCMESCKQKSIAKTKSPAKFARLKMGTTKQAGEELNRQPG